MPEIAESIDVEPVVVAALVADSDLAALVGDKVSTLLPAAFIPEARARVWRSGGTPADESPEVIDRPVLQVEGYGETRGEAEAVVRATIRAMLAMAGKVFQVEDSTLRASVSEARRISGPQWSPDPPTAAPRYLASVVLYVRALPG